MKTLFLFEEYPEGSFFFELVGDFNLLNDIFINGDSNKPEQKELSKLVYDDAGDFIVKKLEQPTKDWDFFVRCGIFL